MSVGMLTRGYISPTDARAMLARGYVLNPAQAPTISMDFCPVAIVVGGAPSRLRVYDDSTSTTITISDSATVIRKEC